MEMKIKLNIDINKNGYNKWDKASFDLWEKILFCFFFKKSACNFYNTRVYMRNPYDFFVLAPWFQREVRWIRFTCWLNAFRARGVSLLLLLCLGSVPRLVREQIQLNAQAIFPSLLSWIDLNAICRRIELGICRIWLLRYTLDGAMLCSFRRFIVDPFPLSCGHRRLLSRFHFAYLCQGGGRDLSRRRW